MGFGLPTSPPTTAAGPRLLATALPAALTLILGLAQARFSDPPRFDGAGYAVLAESIRTGRGYRAIDHPDAPPHAHFPPGYPAVLAAAWTLSGGPSMPVARGLSLACSAGAVALFAGWLLRRTDPPAAGLLAAATACNWAWTRQAAAIQSEPLFALLGMVALLAADRRPPEHAARYGVVLGVALAACVLTRHVGMALAAAVLLDWLVRRRFAGAAAAAATLALALAPWVAWQVHVGRDTQIALFRADDFGPLVLEQARFYVGRIPDLIVGPFVEVSTVFRPGGTGPAMMWASIATGIIVCGWIARLRRPAWRLAGSVPMVTLAVLLCWPFTEAGRFLIPLVPFLIVGAWSGLLIPAGTRGPRPWMAGILVAASLPYTAYSVVSRRADAEAARHADFDAACAWVGREADAPGPILVRQAGEAYWLAGRSRQALAPPPWADPAAVDALIDRYGVAYLIVDDDRYEGAEPGPLARYADERPGRLSEAFRRGPIAVYRVGPVAPASG
jgi:hypothetical protein